MSCVMPLRNHVISESVVKRTHPSDARFAQVSPFSSVFAIYLAAISSAYRRGIFFSGTLADLADPLRECNYAYFACILQRDRSSNCQTVIIR